MVLNMRKLFFLALVLLMPGLCFALRYSLGHHYITIEIDDKGYAKVTERYYLAFKTQQDIEEFAQKKTDLGVNIDAWSRFNPAFGIHVGSKDKLKPQTLNISLTTAKDNYLEISYEIDRPIVRVIKEESRMIVYELNKWVLSSFVEGTDYVIPEGTFITFILPKESTVLEEGELFNYAEVYKDVKPKVMVRGFLAIGSFNLRYIYWKGIAPKFSISFLLKQIIEGADTNTIAASLAIVFIIGIFVYFNRKKLSEKVTNFVVRNTELSEEEELKGF